MSLQENKTNKRHCCVSECKSNSGETSSLHRFPLRDKNLYTKWLKILKIRKPTREMYICSRHFRENDFFGGWLTVEPNKRRLKRGVIPSLELPKSKIDAQKVVDKKNSLKRSEHFAASLNLKPVERHINSIQDSKINGYNKTEENEDTKQNSAKRKVENLELPPTDSDNLLVLKRVGEIKEAPEYQAKKKHEAKMHMKKMRELRKMQVKKLQLPLGQSDSEPPPETAKLKVKTIQELTQPVKNTGMPHLVSGRIIQISPKPQVQKDLVLLQTEVETTQKTQEPQIQVNPQPHLKNVRILSKAEVETIQKNPHAQVYANQRPQVKKVRVLSKAEVEIMEKNRHAQVKKIRVFSPTRVNKIQENSQSYLTNRQLVRPENNIEPAQTQMKTYQSLIKNSPKIIQVKNKTDTIQHEVSKIGVENGFMGRKSQESLNDNLIYPVNIFDTHIENQDNSERLTKIGKLMNDTIGYFDQVMKEMEKTPSHKADDKLTNVKLGMSSSFKSQEKLVACNEPNDNKITTRNLAESIIFLEKMVGQISSEISADESAIPSAFGTQCTQTENNQKEDKSVQTNHYLHHENIDELEKTQQENQALKEEINGLKDRITALERDLLNSRKKGQFLYVFKPQ